MSVIIRDYMTDEEFFDISPDDRKAELIDGEMIVTSPASEIHERVFIFLATVLEMFVAERDLGIVRGSRTAMRLSEKEVYEPDILYVAKDRLSLVHDNYIDGPADLVVEILSRSTAYFDRGHKLANCALAGVREVWLIDPGKRTAEFYRLIGARYEPIPVDTEGVFRSQAMPGFWLRTAWLWEQPKPLQVARELGLV
ncbi:MAG TPA: Uma2 family endonuclease [Anaerolineae bacterium]|nr:Uma2 family endonuclease [Anaerolineae bacterium]